MTVTRATLAFDAPTSGDNTHETPCRHTGRMVTARLTAGERWQELASDLFVPLHVTGDGPAPRVRVDYESVADVSYSRVRSTRGEVVRAEELIDSVDSEIALFSLQLRGSGRVAQRGRTTVVRPAEGVLYLADAPYRLTFPSEVDILVVRVPTPALGLSMDRLRQVVAAPLRTSRAGTLGLLARVVGSSLAGRGLLSSPAETARVSAELLREVLAHHSGTPLRSRSPAALRADVRARILRSVADPGLRVSTLADAAGVSERTVHAAFAEVGSSPAAEIRRTRLERSRRLLETTSLSIVEIALACGFSDPTSYTRAFRRQWQLTPAAHRGLESSHPPPTR
ncbi:helix-turn-helix domain-containing protein [Microbacterium sp. 5K110]|jgi:AraC-like DNA-binding protein|nr:helix-turn-helix domain-containing protein [Microbacterium sp. 5K110]